MLRTMMTGQSGGVTFGPSGSSLRSTMDHTKWSIVEVSPWTPKTFARRRLA